MWFATRWLLFSSLVRAFVNSIAFAWVNTTIGHIEWQEMKRGRKTGMGNKWSFVWSMRNPYNISLWPPLPFLETVTVVGGVGRRFLTMRCEWTDQAKDDWAKNRARIMDRIQDRLTKGPVTSVWGEEDGRLPFHYDQEEQEDHVRNAIFKWFVEILWDPMSRDWMEFWWRRYGRHGPRIHSGHSCGLARIESNEWMS